MILSSQTCIMNNYEEFNNYYNNLHYSKNIGNLLQRERDYHNLHKYTNRNFHINLILVKI